MSLRTLVMGGNRYIGLSLVRELAERGHSVTVANSHEVELPSAVKRIHVDRRIPGELHRALAGHAGEFDVVFDNTAYQPMDVEPMVDMFAGGVANYVFTSSVAVYRRSFVQPVREDFRTHEVVADQPLRAYAVGKVRCERYLAKCFEEIRFPFTSVRVTHTVGPRSPLASRDPALFARLEQGRPILIPGDGFPFVHLIHIDDAARLLASIPDSERVVGQTYNAAGAEYASILGTIHLMARVVGMEPNIVHVPLDYLRDRARSIVHWNEGVAGGTVFSIEKALSEVDWSPRFGLQEAFADSYAWFAQGGRDAYVFDFSDDDQVLADLDV